MLIKGVRFRLYKRSAIGTSKNGCKYLSTKPNDDICDYSVLETRCIFRLNAFLVSATVSIGLHRSLSGVWGVSIAISSLLKQQYHDEDDSKRAPYSVLDGDFKASNESMTRLSIVYLKTASKYKHTRVWNQAHSNKKSKLKNSSEPNMLIFRNQVQK